MRKLLFLGAIALGACRVDVDEDGDVDVEPVPVDPVERTCTNYCDHRAECNDDVDVDACIDDCQEAAGNCQADEQEQALEELDACAEQSCDDVGECTVSASLECYLGL